MKKFLLGVTLLLFGFSMYAGTTNTPVPSTSYSTDYCPEGYVCIATNMTAISMAGYEIGINIKGISIYKKGRDLIAIVPGHGRLKLNRNSEGMCWFYADNNKYYIQEFYYKG